MTDDHLSYNELFQGLKALAESSFPKKCASCGRIFESAEKYLLETLDLNTSKTGLKESQDDDGTKIVEVFRNCPCGSTLMDLFDNRRDLTETGAQRRKKFTELLKFLVDNRFDKKIARMELLKVMRGEKSELLSKISPPRKAEGKIP